MNNEKQYYRFCSSLRCDFIAFMSSEEECKISARVIRDFYRFCPRVGFTELNSEIDFDAWRTLNAIVDVMPIHGKMAIIWFTKIRQNTQRSLVSMKITPH